MSDVLNQYGFLPGAYGDQKRPIEGTEGVGALARSYANPLLNQISTYTWASSDTAGDVSLTIRLPDGTELTALGTDAGATDTTHAATIRDAINTSDAWRNVATATAAGAVVTVTYIHAGFDYPFVGFTAPGAGVLTANPNTQDAGGVAQPVARWVVAAPNPVNPEIPALALPGPGGNLVGVVKRPDGQIVNTTLATNPGQADEAFIASDMVPVVYDGQIYVRNAGSVASTKDAQVFAVVNIAGGDALGETRADDDGANSEPAPAYWVDIVQPGARGLIYVQRGL
jgi:hypothetical protein